MKIFSFKGIPKPVFLAITAIVVMLFSATALGILTVTQTLSSSGSITVSSTPNIGVYSDSQCTQALTSIDWGAIAPGSSASKTVYIKNTGNVPLTLTMTANSWNPAAAPNYLKLTWNKQSSALAVSQSTPAVLTMSVNSGVTGLTSFSLSIAIVGTG